MRTLTVKPKATLVAKRDDPVAGWRGLCHDILLRICVDDKRSLANVRLRVVSRLAMADARRYYNRDKLSADEVMGWPNPLCTKKLSSERTETAIAANLMEYQDGLITPEAQAEIDKTWNLRVYWHHELSKRANEAGKALSHSDLAQWASAQKPLLHEMALAGVLPHERETKTWGPL